MVRGWTILISWFCFTLVWLTAVIIWTHKLKRIEKVCYKLDAKKKILMLGTCGDVVFSNMTELLNTLDYFMARTIRKGQRERKYWDARQNLVIPYTVLHSSSKTPVLVPEPCYLSIQVSQPSLIPSPKDLTWQEQPVEFCLVLVFFATNFLK